MEALGPFISSWGAGTLLTFTVILILTGRLVWAKRTDKTLQLLKESWEERLKEKDDHEAAIIAYYESCLVDNRRTQDTLFQALSGSVQNQSRLIMQSDELMELSRAVTPAFLALRRAVGTPDD